MYRIFHIGLPIRFRKQQTSETHSYSFRTFKTFNTLVDTLVSLVDAEEVANDEIRTHDLTCEGNSVTKKLQSQHT